jgi:hypothetical protein
MLKIFDTVSNFISEICFNQVLKVTDTKTTVFERKSHYLIVPWRREHATPCRATRQGT